MDNKESLITLDESYIKGLVHEIRGQKVMLDFDLARIYDYTTKAFNQQIKNNVDKFESDFMFRLTSEEWGSILRSKNLTANAISKRRYLPFASPTWSGFLQHQDFRPLFFCYLKTEIVVKLIRVSFHLVRDILSNEEWTLSWKSLKTKLKKFENKATSAPYFQ